MTTTSPSKSSEWSSRWIFILAVTGSAVGLGNIWKFPYITGENGGGAFVLVYLVCILLLGIPIMMAEILIGRRGRGNPSTAFSRVAREANCSRLWTGVGGMGIIAAFIILSFYCVIAGWALDYTVLAFQGQFNHISPSAVSDLFQTLMHSPGRLLFWSNLILLLTMLIIARGVKRGLEVALRFMFPLLLLLLLSLVIYAIDSGAFLSGVHFLFRPDFSQLTAKGILIALGHAFFTLSLASGAVMMYGAYLPKKTSIAHSSFIIAAADTLIALLAGLAIFPIVFANNLPAGSGPGLIFETLPIAFGQMPFGSVFASAFFLMVTFAAFTSTIAMLEPTVSWLIERFHLSRPWAAFIATLSLSLTSIGSVLSFNVWSDARWLGLTYFDFSDYLSANILLPLGGLLTALFVGWCMKRSVVLDELQLKDGLFFRLWYGCLRYLAPIAIGVVFLNALGLYP